MRKAMHVFVLAAMTIVTMVSAAPAPAHGETQRTMTYYFGSRS